MGSVPVILTSGQTAINCALVARTVAPMKALALDNAKKDGVTLTSEVFQAKTVQSPTADPTQTAKQTVAFVLLLMSVDVQLMILISCLKFLLINMEMKVLDA